MSYWYVLGNVIIISAFIIAYWILYLRVQKLQKWVDAQKRIEADRVELLGEATENITQVLEGLTEIAEVQKTKLFENAESKP